MALNVGIFEFPYTQMDKNYEIFPSRKDLSVQKIPFRPVKYYTNFYPVQLNMPSFKVYQYILKLDLPDDSAELIRSIVGELRPKLKKEIRFLNSTGKIVFGLAEKKVPLQFILKSHGNLHVFI